MPFMPSPNERFIERDSDGVPVRTWSKLMAGDYHTLPPNYILDAQAIRQDWAGTATSINGADGNPWAFVDQFTNLHTDISQGRVVVPKGFPLMPSEFSLSTRTDRFAGDTIDQLNLNRLRLANYTEDSLGNYTGNTLGVAVKDYYMPVYARALSEPIAVVDRAVIEIPFYQSDLTTGGRELARLVTRITALAKNAGTDADIAVGDYVTVGAGADRGRFINIGASNANSDVVGQIIAIETVDVEGGIRGWMQNKQFDPFYMFREGTWYTDWDTAETFTYPTDYNADYVMPPYSWFGRGLTGLTDGGEYRLTITDTATFTVPNPAVQDYELDLGAYAATFGAAKIVRADGTVVTATNAFTTADVTIVSVTNDGVDDLVAGTWTVSAVDDTTIDSDYAQHINVTFNRGAGNPGVGNEIVVEFSFVAKGQHTGLPVSLDSATVVGIAQVKLTLS